LILRFDEAAILLCEVELKAAAVPAAMAEV